MNADIAPRPAEDNFVADLCEAIGWTWAAANLRAFDAPLRRGEYEDLERELTAVAEELEELRADLCQRCARRDAERGSAPR